VIQSIRFATTHFRDIAFAIGLILIMSVAIPSFVAFGHTLIPSSFWMVVKNVSVEGDMPIPVVHFSREINSNFTGKWTVTIEGVPGGRIFCGSDMKKESVYTRDELKEKVWPIGFFAGDSSCNSIPEGDYLMTICWWFDAVLWDKPLCKTTSFNVGPR